MQPRFLPSLAFGFLVSIASVAMPLQAAHAERIKDLVEVQGIRENQLIGYGLVVGLDGTGDQTTQTPFTIQSLSSMLTQLGLNLPPGTNLQLKNVAAVMVTTMLPAFAQPGQPIDVTVSSLGNSKSLKGGTLLLTPLKGADGQVYAMAQGNLVIAGAGASAAGSKVQINALNAGRVPGGATVERTVSSTIGQGEFVNLEVHDGDVSDVQAIANAINQASPGSANAMDGRVIQLRAPIGATARIAFLSTITALDVQLPKPAAKVIINARTGSVVMNQAVTLEPSAVAHGNLSVSITNQASVSQPGALSSGKTQVVNNAQIDIRAEKGQIMIVPGSAKLTDVVRALNAIGATPQDLLSILQALKAAGALRAELEVI